MQRSPEELENFLRMAEEGRVSAGRDSLVYYEVSRIPRDEL